MENGCDPTAQPCHENVAQVGGAGAGHVWRGTGTTACNMHTRQRTTLVTLPGDIREA